jgi:hypothetical protein
VALNPIIKFTTLFAYWLWKLPFPQHLEIKPPIIGIILSDFCLFFVWRFFLGMRIKKNEYKRDK